MTIALDADSMDIVDALMGRVATLEQRITSPLFAIPNGSTPTFPTINIGTWRGIGTKIPIGQTVGSPTSLTATPTTTYQDVAIDASWIAPVDGTAAQYQIDIALKNVNTGVYSLIDSQTTSGTTAHLAGLAPGQTYGLRVSSVSRIGVVSTPVPVTGWVDVTTVADATVPVAPTGVTATPGATTMMVTWSDNSEPDVARGKGYYEVQYDTTSLFTANPKTSSVTGTLASFAGLTAGQQYYFRVRAHDSSNNISAWSTVVSAVVGGVGGTASGGTDGVAPASSPTPVVTGAVGPALFIKFAMLMNSDPVTYEIHVSTTFNFVAGAGTKSTEAGSSNVLVRQMPDGSPLVYGTTYYVRIIAKDPDGSAPASTIAQGVPLQAGTNDIAVGAITATSGIIGSLDASKITTGTMSAAFLTAGTLTSDRISVAGLDAGTIKFGTMSGDRIATNSIDVMDLKSGTLTARTITLASDGSIVGGSNPLGVGSAQTGFILNGGAMTTYQGGATTFRLDFNTGNAFFAGDISGSSGTFTGSLLGAIITGSTYQTSSSATADRIVIDATGGINLYREATTNYNQQPWFATTYGGSNYQVEPGRTGIIASKWGTVYPGGSNYSLSTPVTNVTLNISQVPILSNPIGAPFYAQYTFGSTSIAGTYQIYYDVPATPGSSWSSSIYLMVSNPTGALTGGWTAFLDSNKVALLSIPFVRLRDGATQYQFSGPNVWERYGSSNINAPAGTAYVRQLVQVGKLTATGGWTGTVGIYGSQIENKDHVTVYCDGNQFGSSWTGSGVDSTSTRAYASVGHLGIGVTSADNFVNASLLAGPADRVIAGYVATVNVQSSASYAYPVGGGVALGLPPNVRNTVANPTNQITFIPGDGIQQDYGTLPYLGILTNGQIGLGPTQQGGSGSEYPQSLTMSSGNTWYAGVSRRGWITVISGSGASGTQYGGVVTINTSGESSQSSGGYVQINTKALDLSNAPIASWSALLLNSVGVYAGSPPLAGIVNSLGDKAYLWSNSYGLGMQSSRMVLFAASGATVSARQGPNSDSATFVGMTASAFTVNSTRDSKTDIKPFDAGWGMDRLRRLHPVRFKSKNFEHFPQYTNRPELQTRISFVAEDVESVLPEVCGYEFDEMDAEGRPFGPPRLVGLDLGAFAPILVHAVQDVDRQIADLTDRVRKLEGARK